MERRMKSRKRIGSASHFGSPIPAFRLKGRQKCFQVPTHRRVPRLRCGGFYRYLRHSYAAGPLFEFLPTFRCLFVNSRVLISAKIKSLLRGFSPIVQGTP